MEKINKIIDKEVSIRAVEFIVGNNWNVMDGNPTDKEMSEHAQNYVKMVKCYMAGFERGKEQKIK